MLVVIVQLESYPAHTQVRLLVEEGKTDVNVRDRWGATPLDEALRTGHPQVSKADPGIIQLEGISHQLSRLLWMVDGLLLVSCILGAAVPAERTQ